MLVWDFAPIVIWRAATGVSAFFMFAMFAMSAMHEKMHQRARQKQEKGQIGDGRRNMRPVFSDQEVSGDHKKADQHDIGRRSKEASLPLIVTLVTLIHLAPFSVCRY